MIAWFAALALVAAPPSLAPVPPPDDSAMSVAEVPLARAAPTEVPRRLRLLGPMGEPPLGLLEGSGGEGPYKPVRSIWSLGALLVPGLLLHGAGHLVGDDLLVDGAGSSQGWSSVPLTFDPGLDHRMAMTAAIAAWIDAPFPGQTGRVIGRAFDGATSAPLAEILVSASGVTAYTD